VLVRNRLFRVKGVGKKGENWGVCGVKTQKSRLPIPFTGMGKSLACHPGTPPFLRMLCWANPMDARLAN